MRRRLATSGRPVAGAVGVFGLLLAATAIYGGLSGASGDKLIDQMLIDLVAVLGLQIFIGNSGVLSFAHIGLGALGAYATAILCTPVGIKATEIPGAPLGLDAVQLSPASATVIGVAFGVACGMLVGFVVMRLSGISAAIVSLAALIVANTLLTNLASVTGGPEGFYGIPKLDSRPVLLIVALVGIVIARVFRESRIGRQLQAARDDELAAAALGIRIARTRLIAWGISLAFVSLSGSLRGQLLGTITPDVFYFDLTFVTLAMLIVGGAASVTGAVSGVLLITAASESARILGDGANIGPLTSPTIIGLPALVLGVILVVVMVRRSSGLMGRWELDDLLPRRRRPEPPPPVAAAHPDGEPAVLRAEDVRVSFGSIEAVSGASLEVPRGEIVGLIGANGAGKSTLLNAISGVLPPASGSVRIDAGDLTGKPSWQVSLAGVARTFQNVRLFGELTAAENLEAAAFAHGDAAAATPVGSLLAEAEIGELGDAFPAAMSYGHQRRLELARALATAPRFLLLDEPAAGMNAAESQQLGETIRGIRDRHGCGVLVIDHDLPFVFALCERIYVLAEGRVIAIGAPEAIRVDPKVVESYIGNQASASA